MIALQMGVMIVVRKIVGEILTLWGQTLTNTQTEVSRDITTLLNGLRGVELLSESGSTDYRDLATYLDRGYVVATVNGDTITTSAQLRALANPVQGGGVDIVAGPGLNKTGNLLEVVANPDGSIVVNPDDIQLGVIPFDKASTALGLPPTVDSVIDFGCIAYVSAEDSFALSQPPASNTVPFFGGFDISWLRLADLVSTSNFAITATSFSITSDNWAHSYLTLSGVLTGDTTATLVVAAGRRCLINNNTTGPFFLAIVGSGGGLTYFGPGESKLLWTDSAGVLQGESLDVWRCLLNFSVTAAGAGSVAAATVRLPPGIVLSPTRGRTTIAVEAAVAPPSIRAGFAGVSSEQAMKNTAVPIAVGTGFGGANASLGTAVDEGGQVDANTAQTVTVTVVNTGACSAGAARLRLLGERI